MLYYNRASALNVFNIKIECIDIETTLLKSYWTYCDISKNCILYIIVFYLLFSIAFGALWAYYRKSKNYHGDIKSEVIKTQGSYPVTTFEPKILAQGVSSSSITPPKNRFKVPSYDDWLNEHHPWGAEIGLWIGLYIAGVLFFGIPLIIVIPLHIVLRTKWRNEYFWMIADESLTVGDYVTASQYCFRFSKYGLDKTAALTIILSTADASERHGDIHKASQLRQFASQF